MKMPMFTTREERSRYLMNMAQAVEDNGLKSARKRLADAEKGIGYKEFMEFNQIPQDKQAQVWEHRLEWLKGEVKSLERKVRKYRNEAVK